MTGSSNTPKIFISYSWSSPQLEQWVEEFAERLTRDGIWVVLDKWELKEGQDKHKFMEKTVGDSTIKKVLVICDEVYQKKADQRKGGVGIETQLISKEVYENTEQEKYIAIVKEKKDGKPCIPIFLESRIYIDLSNEKTYELEYEKLIRNLFDKPKTSRPPLGSAPTYITEEVEKQSLSARQLHNLKVETTEINLSSLNNKNNVAVFLSNFYQDLEKYKISGGREEKFDDEVYKSIGELIKLRDIFVDFVFEVSRNFDDIGIYHFKNFFEKTLNLFTRPEDTSNWTEVDSDNYKFIIQELVLYFISVLIEENRFVELSEIVNQSYFYKTFYTDSIKHSGIEVFNKYIRSLDEIRNKRLSLNRVSITSDLLKERANRNDLTFNKIVQADLLLYYLTSFNQDHYQWFPRTTIYNSFFYDGIELFDKMVSSSFFNKIKVIFKVSTKEQLDERLKGYIRAVMDGQIKEIRAFEYEVPLLSEILKIDNIEKIQ